MPLAAFQQNWLLWMTPEWGSKSDPKIGFADRASPVLQRHTKPLTNWQQQQRRIELPCPVIRSPILPESYHPNKRPLEKGSAITEEQAEQGRFLAEREEG